MKLYLLLENEEWRWLKKDPGLLDAFKSMWENGASEEQLAQIYRQYLEHKPTFQIMQIPVYQMKTLEELTDALQRVELWEKTTRFLNMLPAHLRNDAKSHREELSTIIQDWPIEDWSQNFIKKSNRYRTYNELLAAMRLGQSAVSKQEEEIKAEVIKDPNITIVLNEPGILICTVHNFEGSTKWGSTQWCISRDKYYWDNYTTSKLGKQYFLWDWETSDIKMSRIGVTKYLDDSIVAHDNSDSNIKTIVPGLWWFKYIKPYSEEDLLDKYTTKEIVGGIKNLRSNKQTIPTFSAQFVERLITGNAEIIKYIDIDERDVLELTKKYPDIIPHLNIKTRLKVIKLGKTPERLQFEAEHKLFVWISKEDFVETPEGLYKKLDMPENLIWIDDPTDIGWSTTLQGLALRARFTHQTCWGAWIPNEITEDMDIAHNTSQLLEQFKQDWFQEIIKKIKFRL